MCAGLTCAALLHAGRDGLQSDPDAEIARISVNSRGRTPSTTAIQGPIMISPKATPDDAVLRESQVQQPALMFAVKSTDVRYRSGSAAGISELDACSRRRGGRRRLSKLSCAGWIPHDRGFVSGLPRSRGRASAVPAHNRSRGFPNLAPPPTAGTLCDPQSRRGCCLLNLTRNGPDEADHLARSPS